MGFYSADLAFILLFFRIHIRKNIVKTKIFSVFCVGLWMNCVSGLDKNEECINWYKRQPQGISRRRRTLWCLVLGLLNVYFLFVTANKINIISYIKLNNVRITLNLHFKKKKKSVWKKTFIRNDSYQSHEVKNSKENNIFHVIKFSQT